MITIKELPLYPIFKSGQNLTHDDLNNLRNYLTLQNRLTRTHLIGTGIFYGFEVSLLDGNAVKISKGVGVTSNGHLISLNETIFTKFKQDEISIEKFLCGKDIEELQEIDMLNVIELLEVSSEIEEDQEEEVEGEPVDFGDTVVVLLYEETEKIREICIHTADENGKDGEVMVRKLLMKRAEAEKISELLDTLKHHHTFNEPFIERLGFIQDSDTLSSIGISLESLDSYQALNSSYRSICESAVPRITAAFLNAKEFFSSIFNEEVSFSDLDALNSIVGSTENGGALSLQYVYSYLRDLIDAYRDLIQLDIFQSYSGYPDECRFPYHLSLGELIPPEGGAVQSSRTPFLKVPLPETGYSGLEEARFIKEKMKALLNGDNLNFSVQPNDEIKIKITASKSSLYPLSDRAIPYYYNNLRNKWNFKLNEKQRNYAIPSYHSSTVLPFHQPLLYDLGSWDFFRIEGHIGQELKAVLPALEKERKRLNVPFDIVVLKIEEIQEPKILEGKFTDLQLIYRKVREEIICSGQDNSTLKNRFPEKLKDFNCNNISEFQGSINGDNQSIRCNIKVLEEICALYKERLERLQNIQYFHFFAQEHPGLEHMGGVYSGGTFVLLTREIIANESESRNNTDNIISTFVGTEEKGFSRFIKTQVVADFCLPYTCCNNQSKVVYQIIERVQPSAKFNEEGERKYVYDEDCRLIGQEITFINTSENANYYVWMVDGHPQFTTLDIDERFTFVYSYAGGSTYDVKLIAHNDGLFDEAEQMVDICPTIKLTFDPSHDPNEAGTFIFIKNDDNNQASFQDLLPGGDFELKDQEGKSVDHSISMEGEISPEACEDIHYIFDYSDLPLGMYSLQYRIGECNSEPVNLEIRGQNGDDVILFSRGEKTGSETMSEERSAMLNQRMAANKDKVQALAEDNSLAKTASFKRSQIFVNFSSSKIQEINQNFTKVIQLLSTNLKGSEDEQRQEQYTTLATTVFHTYLDRQVASNVSEVPEAMEEIIKNAVETLKEAGVNISKIKNSWNSKDLHDTLNAPVVTHYTKLLK